MKTDFLATVQHELRTPLTAILGLSDLIEMCWEVWEDSPKLDALRDIQVAARNLDGIVETIIDFSARRRRGADAGARGCAAGGCRCAPPSTVVGERHKGGLPVPVGGRRGLRASALLADPRSPRSGAPGAHRQCGEVQRRPGTRCRSRTAPDDTGHRPASTSSMRGSESRRGRPRASSSASTRWTTPPPAVSEAPAWGSPSPNASWRRTARRSMSRRALGSGRACRCAGRSDPGLDGAPTERPGGVLRCRYNEGGRARRGVSGALYPQSAIAGLNSPPRGRVIGSAPDAPALTTGSRAARAREPRQVRKEAAVSGLPGVPWGHLV